MGADEEAPTVRTTKRDKTRLGESADRGMLGSCTTVMWRWEPSRGLLRPILVTVRFTLALAIATLALAGCSAPEGEDPIPHSEVTAADAAVALVDEAEADLVLIVSNQSLDDEEVRLTVTVDGVTVVDDDFHVEDQHNWISFPLSLPSHGHEVIAESDSGATLRESFEVPRNGTRYAIIEHWTEDDSADTDDASVDLTWQFQRQAPAFG